MKFVKWPDRYGLSWPGVWFLGAVFFAPFSLPAGRALLAIALLGILLKRKSIPTVLGRPFWLWMAYLLIALLASWQGLDPGSSLGDCNKLLWFMGIPVAATLVTNRRRTVQVLTAYVCGSLVRSLDILIVRMVAARRAANGDFLWQVIDRGSMTHGQVLLLALTAATGLFLLRNLQKHTWSNKGRYAAAFLLLLAALLANFKRGSWAATACVLGCFTLLSGRWKWFCGLVLLLALTATLPSVQHRIRQLGPELDLRHGGRLVMWTQIAPELLRQHPQGVGFRGVQESVMQETARALGVRVEEGRNHLHSNFVEIPVTLGWVGLIVYLMWMASALHAGLATTWSLRRNDPEGGVLALTCSMMLLGLILNGLVEYNMGDAYLILMYGILIGILGRGAVPFQDAAVKT